MHDCLRSLTLCLAWWKWRENGGKRWSTRSRRRRKKGEERGEEEGIKLSRMFRNTTLLSVPLHWSVQKGGGAEATQHCRRNVWKPTRNPFVPGLLHSAMPNINSTCQRKWNLLFFLFSPFPRPVASNSTGSHKSGRKKKKIRIVHPEAEPEFTDSTRPGCRK